MYHLLLDSSSWRRLTNTNSAIEGDVVNISELSDSHNTQTGQNVDLSENTCDPNYSHQI